MTADLSRTQAQEVIDSLREIDFTCQCGEDHSSAAEPVRFRCACGATYTPMMTAITRVPVRSAEGLHLWYRISNPR